MQKSDHTRSLHKFYLFLIGLGSATKVFFMGTLALSEIAVFPIAPIILLKDYKQMRREGFATVIYMIVLLVISMIISSLVNHTNTMYMVKSFAVMYAVFSYYVVFHRLLKDNQNGLGYYVAGAAISSIITIFAFNPHTAMGDQGSVYIESASVADVLSGPLFWAHRLNLFAQIPIVGAYLAMPLSITVSLPFAYSAFVLLTTISGRSASATFIMAGGLMLLGGKSHRSLVRMGRHLLLLCLIGFLGVMVLKSVYTYCAESGMLGDAAKEKYENQTRKGNSLLRLIVAGREEFFIGLSAALHRPIVGFGPFAKDEGGYYEDFIAKYGDSIDMGFVYAIRESELKTGSRHMIPTHSHIVGAWVHYGLFGLIFYCIILKFMWDHLRRYAPAIPQWHGYFSLFICKYLWDIFFSGFYSRPDFALFLACLMFARAVAQGKLQLPYDMVCEAEKYERR